MDKKDYTLTVQQLFDFCKSQIESWNWDKKILISSDDEGNSYHGLFYQFTDDYDEIKQCIDFWVIPSELDIDPENTVLLG